LALAAATTSLPLLAASLADFSIFLVFCLIWAIFFAACCLPSVTLRFLAAAAFVLAPATAFLEVLILAAALALSFFFLSSALIFRFFFLLS